MGGNKWRNAAIQSQAQGKYVRLGTILPAVLEKAAKIMNEPPPEGWRPKVSSSGYDEEDCNSANLSGKVSGPSLGSTRNSQKRNGMKRPFGVL
jgi:hypothetical protein